MTMSFKDKITEQQINTIKDLLGDSIKVIDGEGALLEKMDMLDRRLMTEVANAAKQVVTVDLNDLGEIKTMSDGSRYKATAKGWVKIEEII